MAHLRDVRNEATSNLDHHSHCLAIAITVTSSQIGLVTRGAVRQFQCVCCTIPTWTVDNPLHGRQPGFMTKLLSTLNWVINLIVSYFLFIIHCQIYININIKGDGDSAMLFRDHFSRSDLSKVNWFCKTLFLE